MAGLAGAASAQTATRLDEITVQGQGAASGEPGRSTVSNPEVMAGVAPAYPGGQVARGARSGFLGNREYNDTPYSIASYTDKTIRDQQATSVAEVLTNSDPSIRSAIGSGNRYDAITIRGFRVDNGEFALNGLYGLVPDFRINPAPAARIEILKGPGAFLYGVPLFGSIGGTVNVVTKRPTEGPLTRVTSEYISDARFGSHADVSRRLGDENQFGIRINAGVLGGRAPYDGQDQLNGVGSIALDYRGERLRLFGDVIYQNDHYDRPTRGYLPLPGFKIPNAPDPRTNLSQDFDFSSASSITALGRAEYDLTSDVMLYGAIGGNRFQYRKQESPGPTIINGAGDATSFSRFQNGDSIAVSGEVGARARFDTGGISHELVINATSIDQDTTLGQITYGTYLTNLYNPTRLASPAAPTAASFARGPSGFTRLNSVGVADTMSVYGGLVQLIVGARRVQIDSGVVATQYDQGATTPSVALIIKPTKTLSFYGNYIEGFTAPSPPPDGAINTNQVFAPVRTKQYEIGAKVDFGTFGGTMAAFEIALPTGLIDPFTQVYSISGEQRHRGLEATFFGELTSGFRVLGGATFVDGRLAKTQGGLNDGNRAVGVPRFQSNLGLEWDTPSIPGLTAIGRMIYTSSAVTSADNTQSVPDWMTFDLGLRFTTVLHQTPVTYRATITNIADSRYFIANPTGYLISGPPRTFWLSASAEF